MVGSSFDLRPLFRLNCCCVCGTLLVLAQNISSSFFMLSCFPLSLLLSSFFTLSCLPLLFHEELHHIAIISMKWPDSPLLLDLLVIFEMVHPCFFLSLSWFFSLILTTVAFDSQSFAD